jgi:hypothetical protein
MTQETPLSLSTGLVPGSGMSARAYALVLATSVALFVFWGGPLWTEQGSHAGRFAVSYLAVIPLSAAALAHERAFGWARLATAVGTLWAIKLAVTAPLYYALARGGAFDEMGAVHSAPVESQTAPAPPEGYRAAPEGTPFVSLRGVVRLDGEPTAGALVYLESPAPGRPLADGAAVPVTLTPAGFDADLYLARTADLLELRNRDARLHTVHVAGGSRSLFNAPLPGGTSRRLAAEERGLYRLGCDAHGSEHAHLLVVDHPYATRTGDGGRFTLAGVPIGPARLVALVARGAVLREGALSIDTTDDLAENEIVIDGGLEAGHE